MSDYKWQNDLGKVLEGLGSGVGGALQHSAQLSGSEDELREVARRRKAEMLSRALKRRQGIHGRQRQHGAESAGNQAQGLQDVARGFVESLRGNYYQR